MLIELVFATSKNSSYNTCSFPNIEYKQAYVVAEFHNLPCQEAYYKYQAARLEERHDAAEHLDAVRFSFAKKWYAANVKEEADIPPLPDPPTTELENLIA